HTDLKNRFAEHKRNGKEVVYISKRTDPAYRRQNQEIISLEEFAKVVYSFQKNPFAFADKTSFLFDDSESGGYIWVFGDGKEIWTTMPEPEFRLRSAIWWLSKAFSEQMREDKKKLTDTDKKDVSALIVKNALERKWLLLFVARLILEK